MPPSPAPDVRALCPGSAFVPAPRPCHAPGSVPPARGEGDGCGRSGTTAPHLPTLLHPESGGMLRAASPSPPAWGQGEAGQSPPPPPQPLTQHGAALPFQPLFPPKSVALRPHPQAMPEGMRGGVTVPGWNRATVPVPTCVPPATSDPGGTPCSPPAPPGWATGRAVPAVPGCSSPWRQRWLRPSRRCSEEPEPGWGGSWQGWGGDQGSSSAPRPRCPRLQGRHPRHRVGTRGCTERGRVSALVAGVELGALLAPRPRHCRPHGHGAAAMALPQPHGWDVPPPGDRPHRDGGRTLSVTSKQRGPQKHPARVDREEPLPSPRLPASPGTRMHVASHVCARPHTRVHAPGCVCEA